jgi:hypothetical protein
MDSADIAADPRPRRDRSRSPAPERPSKKKNLAKGFKFQTRPEPKEDNVDHRQYRDREEEYRPKRFGGREDREKIAERNRDREDAAPKDFNKEPPTGPRQNTRGNQKPNKTKPKKQMAASSSSSAFILVTVNDRLGTKATIPCLPSDTVGDFKKLVAAQIGRTPGEIMLKRQSERPFKDHITLADYGVSNGVQLDLELDTGD